uniref:Capsid n=1 Tax=Porcine astrovirus PAstV-2/2007/HUN TaxID=909668 RepID=E3TB09_PASV1|nr:capsid [Porcine astrovirus PAstV-2/2007/HUN]
MANNQKNVQPTVVTTTTSVVNRRGRRRRRRANRPSQANTTTVRKVTTTRQPARARRRRRNRPGNPNQQAPPILRQRVTATLGTIGSNQGDAIELEMAALLNPALTKETTGSNQFGPLQMWAANYNMWRANNILIKFIPLVGGSAVSGTAIRCSLNLSATPGSPSWSALGARRHKDTNPGKPMTMRIPGSALAGPKEGWFLCSTKNDPQMCIGGSIEVHTLGKTMSTYQAKPFEGPLFLVEMTAEWWFKNYNPEPGMMNLVKTEIQEKPQTVKINATPGEPITISVPKDSQMARATGSAGIEADATPSEIIWSVFDTTMDVVTGILPPPYEWLFRAGWWFVKRVANKKKAADSVAGEPDAGEITFQVFQSLSDAKNDVPCLATGEARSENAVTTGWHLTQVTPGNVGAPQATLLVPELITQHQTQLQVTSIPNLGRSAFYGHIHTTVPPFCIAVQEALGDKKVYTYTAWELDYPAFTQNGQPVDPAQLQSQPYPILAKKNSSFTQIGRVYAANYARIGTSKPIFHWTTVLWRADVTTDVQMQGNTDRTDRFVFIQPTQSPQTSNFPTTVYDVAVSPAQSFSGGHSQTRSIVQGKWYLSAFVACQIADNKASELSTMGCPSYLSLGFPNFETSRYDLPREAFDIGAAMQTTRPLLLKPPVPTTTVLTASEVAQLRQLLAPRDNYPPSEYDLEMPPLEGEEEGEQGAPGGYSSLEGVKQQRVRGPQCIPVFETKERTPTPYPEEEEEDEDESDLDDDDYAEAPSAIRNLLTPKAKTLLNDLQRMGLEPWTKLLEQLKAHTHTQHWIFGMQHITMLWLMAFPHPLREIAHGVLLQITFLNLICSVFSCFFFSDVD